MKLTNPRELSALNYDYLLVAIMRRDAYENALNDLISIGIPQEKIRWVSDDIIINASDIINSVIGDDSKDS